MLADTEGSGLDSNQWLVETFSRNQELKTKYDHALGSIQSGRRTPGVSSGYPAARLLDMISFTRYC